MLPVAHGCMLDGRPPFPPFIRERAELRRIEPRPRMDTRESVTDLLVLAAAGDRGALDRAFPLVYGRGHPER